MQKAQERLYLTADKAQLVGAGDKRAAFLYAAVGDEIPDSAAVRFGLVDGRLKGRKEKPAGEDKELDPDGDKGGTGRDDLTRVKGIGAAKAKALAAAGIDTFAKLAAIDPAKPPATIAGVGEADWSAWAAEAKALASPPGSEA